MQPTTKLLNEIVEGHTKEDEARSLTRQEFCALERMSLTTYAKLQKLKFGPEEVRFEGLAFVRITAKARAEWHEKIEKHRKSQQMQLERQRRSAIAYEAGKTSVKVKAEKRIAGSPKPVSRKKANRA